MNLGGIQCTSEINGSFLIRGGINPPLPKNRLYFLGQQIQWNESYTYRGANLRADENAQLYSSLALGITEWMCDFQINTHENVFPSAYGIIEQMAMEFQNAVYMELLNKWSKFSIYKGFLNVQ